MHAPFPPQTANWPSYTSAEYGYSLRYPPQWFDLESGPDFEHSFSNDKNGGSLLQMPLDSVLVTVTADCRSAMGPSTLISVRKMVVDTTATIRYELRSSTPDGILFAAVATVEPGGLCYRIAMLGFSQTVIESDLADFDLVLQTIRFSARTAPLAGTPVATLPPRP
jgi:hypothetical protein